MLLPIACFSQNQDFELWTSVQLQKNLFKNFELHTESGLRFENNAGQFKMVYLEAGFEYELAKAVDIEGDYRFEKNKRRTADYLSTQNRIGANIQLKQDIGRFGISYRFRIQNTYIDYYSSETGKIPESLNRNRFKIDYNINNAKINPFVFYEMYVHVNDFEKAFINRHRWRIGAQFGQLKNQDIELFFQYQQEINIDEPIDVFILGVDYIFK